MNNVTRILIVEDQFSDYVLAQREIQKALSACQFTRVEKEAEFRKALIKFQPDVILSDYKLPQFDGMRVLEIVQQQRLPTPVIIWTGAMSEDVAVECMKHGASNYVLKENLKRLGPVVMQALKEGQAIFERTQAEEKYQSIFENSPVGIFQSTPQGRFISVNGAMARIYGYASPEEMIGAITDIASQIYSASSDREEFTQLLRNNKSVESFESENIRKDGSRFWTSTSARAVHDETGSILYYEGFLQDITDRKLAEAKLWESEARYHGIFENAQDAILIETFEGDILEVNPRACEIYGYVRDEFLQKKVIDLVPSPEYIVNLPEAHLIPGQAIETINVRANGEYFPVELSGSLYTLGTHRLVLIILRDITERKQTEEALREERNLLRILIDNLPDRIYAMDRQGRKTLSNIADWKVSGKKTMGEVLGKTDFDIYPAELAAPFWKSDKAVIDSGQPLINFEEPGLDANGNRVSILTTKIPLRDEEGNVIGLVGVGRDITERKQSEARINELLSLNERILNNSPLGILTYKLSGECIFANQNAASIIGTNVESLLSQNFRLIEMWKEYGLYDLVEKVISSKTVVTGDVRLISTFGKEIWMTVHGVTFTLNEEEHVLLSLLDITEHKRAESAEREQRLLAEALRDTSQILSSSLDYGKVLDHILAAVGQVVPHDAATITLIEDGVARVVRSQGYEKRTSNVEIMGVRLPLTDTTNLRVMLETKQPVIVYDTHTYAGWKRMKSTDWLRSNVGAPISIGEKIIGFILLDSQTPEFFTPVHAEHLQAFANQAAVAIHNADLLQQAQNEIAERKRAEEALQQNEAILAQAGKMARLGAWNIEVSNFEDLNNNPLHWSEETYRIFGYEPGSVQVTNSLFFELVHPEDRRKVADAVGQAVAEKKNYEIEHRIIRPDGVERLVLEHAEFTFNEQGRLCRILGALQDITERRQAEQELRASEERFRQLAENIEEVFWMTDVQTGKEIYISPAGEKVWGRSEEYFLQEPDAFMNSIFGDDLPMVLQNLEKEKNGESVEMEYRIIHPDATIHWIWDRAFPIFDENGTVKTLAGIAADVTNRKQAEEETRRRANETSALLQTSLALTNLDSKTILQTIGNSAKSLFAADGCRVFLMQPDGETLRCVMAIQESVTAFSDLKIKLGEGVTGSVAASGIAEIVNEMQNDPRGVQVAGTEEEKEAIMFAPLKERDRTIGVLSIRRVGEERPFQSADLELLEAFASMAASAVSNARLFEEAKQRLDELEAIYENGLAVSQLLEPTEIGQRIIETFARYLSWHHVTIRLIRPETDELEVIAFNLPSLHEEQRIAMEDHFNQMVSRTGQGLSGWVVQTGTPVRTGNVHTNPRYVVTQTGIQSGLYMPLKIGDRIIGVISVESESPNAFTEQDERLLATLASQAAVAFENARLYQAAHQELLERTRAQAALWASETHYRELADSITDILFELDYNLKYTHWNKASEMFSGIPAEDAIGKTMKEVWGESSDQLKSEEIYKKVLSERQAKTFEIDAFVKDRKQVLEIHAYPSTRGVSVVVRDVTERKLDETLIQKRVELIEYSAHHSLEELMQKTVDEASKLTDSHIGFLTFIEEDQKTIGLRAWSSETLQVVGTIEDKDLHLALDKAGVWADAFRQRSSVIHNDYEALPDKKGIPDYHPRVIRELVIPIIRDDKVSATLGIGNKPEVYTQRDIETVERFADYAWDIIERRQMEAALADERNQLAKRVEERTADLSRANSNLARALRVKDEFLANMSHELRTPLNAILGLSESLSEQVAGPLNEKQQRYLSTINESGRHLLSLINDILDLAKIEAGQITLDINKVDINSVCQASLRMIKQLAQKKNQEVVFNIENNIGLMWADERRLKQMIVNLLSNAVKFTPESGRLGLEVYGDEAANRVQITVWDNGIGISNQDMERLFKPFVQLDAGLAREATGTGLGLALVAQMARLHGGSVSVESQVGQGSRFTILLPWEPALAVDASTRLRNTGKFRAIDPNATNKPTILVIEDTREVIMMLVDYLEMSGFKMITAQDGTDGIQQAKLFRPDLILMDIMMPGMDGFETTRKLRLDPQFKNTPIIALTALAMPSDRQRCLDAGMDEYISKPVNLKALVKLIQSILLEKEDPKSK